MSMMKQMTYFLLYSIMIFMLQDIKILYSEKFPYYFDPVFKALHNNCQDSEGISVSGRTRIDHSKGMF